MTNATLLALFHTLWGRASHREDYDKSMWTELQAGIQELMKQAEAVPPPPTREPFTRIIVDAFGHHMRPFKDLMCCVLCGAVTGTPAAGVPCQDSMPGRVAKLEDEVRKLKALKPAPVAATLAKPIVQLTCGRCQASIGFITVPLGLHNHAERMIREHHDLCPGFKKEA